MTITDVLTPTPPERFEFIVKSMVSNSVKLCDVDTATWEVIFCAFPMTCVWFDSKRYSKLSVGVVLKNIVSPFLTVDNPTKSLEILFANTVEPEVKLKLADTAWVTPVPHTILPAPLGIVNVSCWLFTNGWLGKNILLAGTLITFDLSPVVNDFPIATTVPAVSAKPTCSFGLKKTLSFIFDSNGSVTNGMVNLCGTVETVSDNACPEPPTIPRFTLNIFLSSNVLRTCNFSVPIPILLPADTLSGIDETYMSVTTPAVAFAPIALYKTTISDDTPTLWESVNPEILVDRPETTILSLSEYVWDVDINALTCVSVSLTKTTSSYVCTVVVTLDISLPVIFDTKALAPPPEVPVLSKDKLSLTL